MMMVARTTTTTMMMMIMVVVMVMMMMMMMIIRLQAISADRGPSWAICQGCLGRAHINRGNDDNADVYNDDDYDDDDGTASHFTFSLHGPGSNKSPPSAMAAHVRFILSYWFRENNDNDDDDDDDGDETASHPH